MQTAEDVQREVLTRIAAYLTWLRETGGWFGVDQDSPWRTRMLAPYVCQRGLVFEIGTLPLRDQGGMRLAHTNHSTLMWFTRCEFHRQDRRGRYMGCRCHPLARPDLLAAYHLGGIEVIGSKSFVRNVPTPANPDARARYVERPLYKAQYQEMLWEEWCRMVERTVTKVGLDDAPGR